MAKTPRGDRHKPGYVCPKRRERAVFNIYLEHELADSVREVTAAEGSTIQDAGERLFREYVRRAHNKRSPS
jgi:hypothetical protein